MLERTIALAALLSSAAACAGDPDTLFIELAPDVISSEDGTVHAAVLAVADGRTRDDSPIRLTVSYTDRNGVDHAIDAVEGKTDEAGRFDAVFEGLIFGGTGTITAEALDDSGNPVAQTEASFTVLDRTPPVVTILPPTSNLVVGAGLPMEVRLDVADELGLSEVLVEAAGDLDSQRSTVIASGATDTIVAFDFDIPSNAADGPTITLYAQAKDLSGNIGVAEPVVLNVDGSITITTPGDLVSGTLVTGDQAFLDAPTALALSPMDGQLYVADNSGGACNGACIRAVDPADGSVAANPVVVGQGTIEGIAFDATGDNLFYSDRTNRLRRLTWDGAAYSNGVDCNDPNNDNPQEPFHMVFDATLGLLVTDQQDDVVKRQAACDGSDPGDFTAQAFELPWGIAAGAGGEYYVSDNNDDVIFEVDGSGTTTPFETRGLDRPRGLVWVGGSSDFADSLLVANHEGRDVLSTRGGGDRRNAAFLRNNPVDIHLAGDTLYILTEPSAGDPGRIYTVTGF